MPETLTGCGQNDASARKFFPSRRIGVQHGSRAMLNGKEAPTQLKSAVIFLDHWNYERKGIDTHCVHKGFNTDVCEKVVGRNTSLGRIRQYLG